MPLPIYFLYTTLSPPKKKETTLTALYYDLRRHLT